MSAPGSRLPRAASQPPPPHSSRASTDLSLPPKKLHASTRPRFLPWLSGSSSTAAAPAVRSSASTRGSVASAETSD
eukprot:7383167-Prymnesium_polylepis.1